ncbi:hypothetical protein FOH38_05565 [Lysinibacillus fusiformis]|nr:hypothetical protein FOH38_05565 [Lysinibacillus fusiformis]
MADRKSQLTGRARAVTEIKLQLMDRIREVTEREPKDGIREVTDRRPQETDRTGELMDRKP